MSNFDMEDALNDEDQEVVLVGAITFMDAPLEEYEESSCTQCSDTIFLGPKQRSVQAQARGRVHRLCLPCLLVLQAQTGEQLNPVEAPDLRE